MNRNRNLEDRDWKERCPVCGTRVGLKEAKIWTNGNTLEYTCPKCGHKIYRIIAVFSEEEKIVVYGWLSVQKRVRYAPLTNLGP